MRSFSEALSNNLIVARQLVNASLSSTAGCGLVVLSLLAQQLSENRARQRLATSVPFGRNNVLRKECFDGGGKGNPIGSSGFEPAVFQLLRNADCQVRVLASCHALYIAAMH